MMAAWPNDFETLAEMEACEHVHYMTTTVIRWNYSLDLPKSTVKYKPYKRQPDKISTFIKAKNPMVRNDKRLQRGF